MGLERKFYLSTDMTGVRNMGTSVPAWKGNYLKQNRWYDGNPDSNYFYSIHDNDVYIQNGQNTNYWATNKFFGQSLKVESEKENSDGSITAEVLVRAEFFASRVTDFVAGGVSVDWTVKINDTTAWTFNGMTNQEFTHGASVQKRFTVTIPPQQHDTKTCLTLIVKYPNGEYKNSTTIVGLALYNNNPPTFRPFAVRKSNVFKSCNNSSGILRKRVSGTWKDIPKMGFNEQGVQNKGTSRIRKNGIWKGQSKVGT